MIELATTLSSQQTNSVIISLGLFTYVALENNKSWCAALFPIIAFCIKGYGIIFMALFFFYPDRARFIGYSILWLTFFSFLPLPFTGHAYFITVYKDWFECLAADHANNFGYSIMGLTHLLKGSFTQSDLFKVQLWAGAGMAVTWALNLITGSYRCKNRRMLLLAYCTIWVIIFNHASEPPTFIISSCGVAIFLIVNRESFRRYTDVVAILFLFFSIVAHKDIYPVCWPFGNTPSLVAKTLPCALIWAVLQIQLCFKEKGLTTPA